MNKHNTLTKLGLVPYSDTANTIYQCLHKTFEIFGEEIAELFAGSLATMHRLPKEVIMLKFDLIEKSIRDVYGYSADYIINRFQQELWRSFPSLQSFTDPVEITTTKLQQIQEHEVYMFLRNIPQHEHIVFLYTDDQSKYPILSSYFDKSVRGPKGLISNDLHHSQDGVISTTYNKIFDSNDKQGSMRDLAAWIADIYSSSSSNRNPAENSDFGFTRIAGDEESWFLTNGFREEIRSLERHLRPRLSDKMSKLCVYNEKYMFEEEEIMSEIVLSHSRVITDQPMMMYTRRQQIDDYTG